MSKHLDKSKLVYIKTWEIELLDSHSGPLGMSLWDAMITICHPSNPKFAPFHSMDKSWREACHILTVLKLAKSFVHATILALLPYLQWKFTKEKGNHAAAIIAKWLKPASWAWATNAY